MYRKSRVCTLNILLIVLLGFSVQHLFAEDASVKIHYLGHAAFVMEFDNGVTIVSDYGNYNAWAQWGWDSPIYDIGDLVPDIMTYSHHHEDHYDPSRVPDGVTHILTGTDSLEYKGISIKPTRTCEENYTIESNTSYLFTYKNLRILHLGDAQSQIININNPDVQKNILQILPDSLDMLFMTIEGKTKFISEAEKFISLLAPKRIIPIHYWSQVYLNKFLEHLDIKKESIGNYKIIKNNSSDYLLDNKEVISPTKVVVLERSAYRSVTN